MENKYQVVALIGKAGAGKDLIQRITHDFHPEIFHSIVSCTTRPPRDNEKEGVDYHYLSTEEFTHKVLNGDMFEATEFNGWFYGTEYNSLVADKINIGTFNPAGVSALLEAPNITTMVIYVDAPDKTRLLRYLQRSENPNCAEMCRRYFADEKDFDNLEFEYYVFSNPDGNCPDLLENHGIMIPISRMWINLGKDQESFNNTMKLIKAK